MENQGTLVKEDNRDRLAWNLGLGLAIAAITIWAMASVVLEGAQLMYLHGFYFAVASLFRMQHVVDASRGPSFLWAVTGSVLFFFVATSFIFLPFSPLVLNTMAGAAIFADMLLGLAVSRKLGHVRRRAGFLMAGAFMVGTLLIFNFDLITGDALLSSFLLVTGLSVHSVTALALYLHLQTERNAALERFAFSFGDNLSSWKGGDYVRIQSSRSNSHRSHRY